MNTRAGVKISKLFLSGVSGITLLLASLVLFFNGYKITGMRSIDPPTNWISLHPGLSQKVIESIFISCKKITTLFASRILDGKRNYRALIELPVDLFFAPFSVLYFFIGRFIFAKSFYASGACNNCGICIKQYAVKAIGLVDKRIYWSYKCESCMHCMNICPERAIETAHGYIIGLLILLNTLVQSFIYRWLINHNIPWFTEGVKYSSLLRFLLEITILFFSLIVSYRMLHYLRKIKAFDMFINYTSLKFYKFWGRYKPSGKFKT